MMDSKEASEKSISDLKDMHETLQANHDQHAQHIIKLQHKLECIDRTIATKPNITMLLELEQESLAKAQAAMQIVEQQMDQEKQHMESMMAKGSGRK